MPFTEESFLKLEEKLNLLVEENEQLKKRQLASTKKEWTKFKNVILDVVIDGDKFEGDFENFKNSVERSIVFSKLLDANNPCSNVLGFTFTDIIRRLAIANFKNALPAGVRPRFEKDIAEAVDNPIWGVILKSNPVTMLVSSVVDKVAGFIKKIKIKRENVLSIDRAYDKVRFEKFMKELQPYIQFYDELVRASKEYQLKVNELVNRKVELKARMENYHGNFLTTLGIQATSGSELNNEVNAKLNPSEDTVEAYLAILANADFLKAHKIAKKFPTLKTSVLQYKLAFYNVLNDFLDKNVSALEAAKSFKNNNPEIEEILGLVNEQKEDLENKIKEASVALSH